MSSAHVVGPRRGRRRRRRGVQIRRSAPGSTSAMPSTAASSWAASPSDAVRLHRSPDRGSRGLDHRVRGDHVEARTGRDEQRAAPARHRLVDRVGERAHAAGALGAARARRPRSGSGRCRRRTIRSRSSPPLRHREQAALRLRHVHRIGPQRGRHLARRRRPQTRSRLRQQAITVARTSTPPIRAESLTGQASHGPGDARAIVNRVVNDPFRALSHPIRRGIVERLGSGPATVGDATAGSGSRSPRSPSI